MEDTELRERLDGLAWRSAPAVRDSDELVRSIESGVRTRRRRQWTLAAVAAVAAVLVAVPLSRSDEDTGPAAPAPRPAPEIYTIPTRGNLAFDDSLVDAVRRLPWTARPGDPQVEQPPVNTRNVVFVGDFAGTRWALVAAADSTEPPPRDVNGDGLPDLDRLESLMVAWFAGPAADGADGMTLQTVPLIVGADQPTGLSDLGSRFVAVVAAPGDDIELSPMRWIEPDGQITREAFFDLNAQEGVAVIDGGHMQASIDQVMRYRVLRDGVEVVTDEFDALGDPDFVVSPFDVTRLRPAAPPAPGDAAVDAVVDHLYAHLGGGPGIADFTVMWAGDVPLRTGGTGRLTVLAAQFRTLSPEFEGGAVYLIGVLGQEGADGRITTTNCGSQIRPAGTPVDEMVVLVHCGDTGSDRDPPTGTLVVVAPSTATRAQLWHDDELIGGLPLTNGVAVVAAPAQTFTVEVLDGGGRPLDRRAPMSIVVFDD
jgi:hypothetical protein